MLYVDLCSSNLDLTWLTILINYHGVEVLIRMDIGVFPLNLQMNRCTTLRV